MLGAALAITAPSAGQNALGVGSALDGNLGEGTSGYNAALPMTNYRGRNLLVTGNVAGGRGFRDTVGYTAEYDFRGETGADDLFQQRAYSAFSAPNFLNAGRTMELLRFGQYLNEVEYQTATRGSTIQNLNQMPYVADDLDNRISLDQVAISSTTSAIYDAVSDNRMVGLLHDQEGRRFSATASSLMGIQVAPLESRGNMIGLSTYDMARAVDDTLAGHGSKKIGGDFNGGFQNLLSNATPVEPINSLVEPDVTDTRVVAPTPQSYTEILQQIVERHAGPDVDVETRPELLSELDRQFAELQAAMTSKPDYTADATAERPATADHTLPGLPEALGPSEQASKSGPPDTASAIEAIVDSLRHGRSLEHYAAEDPTRFNELMNSGEQRLAEGQYFWAERHFDRALRFTPGHPLATAGMGHAQIGAGLYVPAALTLQRLLKDHPEMIDVRYRPGLLPSATRLDVAVEQLRDRIERVDRDRDLRGFVLAYIGHQRGDRAMVEEGLGYMPDDPFRTLLEAVWLGEEGTEGLRH